MPYERSNFRHKWRLERLARSIRESMQLALTDILNPYLLADRVPAHVFCPEDLVSAQLAARARQVNWDGFDFSHPGEQFLFVVLNPARPTTRRCATLLEEISHHLLGHQPSRLYMDPATGLLRREFNRTQEEEAYDFGSVLLLPKELIQQHVKEVRGSARELATQCGCSTDYVELRIKRCRLWNRYIANQQTATPAR